MVRYAIIMFALLAFDSSPAKASDCARLTVVECEQFVLNELERISQKTDSPPFKPKLEEAAELVSTVWGKKFEAAYRALPEGARASTSDLEKLKSELSEKLDPVSYSVDFLVDEVAKKYFPRVATVLAVIGSAPAQGLFAFFWPSSIVTEAQELRMSNERVQKKLWSLFPRQNAWKNRYELLLQQRVTPAFTAPSNRLP